MHYETILFDVRDNVAHITLNRPEAANSINLQMAKDLMHVASNCKEDASIRAVLLSGAGGRMFCSGGDIKGFAAQGENLPPHIKELTTYLHVGVSRLVRLAVPVIAAVQGSAAGAGMSLACACDLVIAADNARFTLGYTRIGLAPDGSGTYSLPRIIGEKRTMELALTNRILSAQEALEWGIVTRVVLEDELMAQAEKTATELAAGPTMALAAAKRLIQNSWRESLESQIEYECQAITDMSRTVDSKEGITAFLEKRPASFRGI